MKKVKLSLREFALPSPLSGSIEMYSGHGATHLEGIELHQVIQKRRAKEDPLYSSEVKISHEFEKDEYCIQIEGRMDGFFDHAVPKIEEIKSSFNIRELAKHLQGKNYTHPYSLQLLSYGYFFWLKNNNVPDLSFHLVSTRNHDSLDLILRLKPDEYEDWLDRRLSEIIIEAKRAEKRRDRRKKAARNFPFPFEKPRSGQIELIESIKEGMENKQRMLIQAPTGLGKTIGVLYPTLKEALNRGQRVVYVTPKNSQHSVAEDAVEKFQEKGSNLKSLTITAKSKLCMKAEPICNPEFCEYAKNYYDKLHKENLKEILSKKRKLTYRIFKQLGEKHLVCPFELQLEAAQEADIVICDYNYVFSNNSALSRLPLSSYAQEGKPNLVVDEAHNLPARTMGHYSPTLSTWVLEKMRSELKKLPNKFAREGEEFLDDCLTIVRNCAPKTGPMHASISISKEPFLEMEESLRGFLSRYLEADIEIKQRDVVIQLCFYWGEFTETLKDIVDEEREEFFTTFQLSSTGGTIKITCCDASEKIKSKYENFENVVNFSATLKPFDYYARLSGLSHTDLKVAEFKSPFDSNRRKLLLIPQISTKYSEREKNYSKIADAISKIACLKEGNYLVFFPSFEFMEQVKAVFKIHSSFHIMKQEKLMKNSEIEFVINELKSQERPIILFAVQGGVFSEGVDYPGKTVIGAFVVGPPLPQFDLERELMKEYYQKNYEEGFDYAYSYPAMSKAIQSAGRVIRSETDKGLIVLMDNRFLEKSYAKSMPLDWFNESPRELVSTSILKDINKFWSD